MEMNNIKFVFTVFMIFFVEYTLNSASIHFFINTLFFFIVCFISH